MRHVVVACRVVATTAGVAGCLDGQPELDDVFRVDEIRYWWDGENASLLDEKAQEALVVTSHSPEVGPGRIPPNASLAPEIAFKPRNPYTGTDGYYAIEVSIMQDDPQQMREGNSAPPWVEYYAGCFNHDTGEFYGYWKPEGHVCDVWDCTGEGLSRYSIDRNLGIPKPEHIPDCDATDAVGPYYEDMEWGDG